MLPRSSFRSLAALGGLALSVSLAVADPIDGTALLNLLVRKGIVTPQEAANITSELTPASPAASAGASSVAGSGAPLVGSTAPASSVTPEKDKKSPLSFKIGVADFTPVGFLDFTSVYRSTNVGSGIGTNFAAIPYGNTAAGRLSETRFSAQNSRLGLRVDSAVNDTKVLGYVESDFLGNAANTLGISSNSATLRMRLYFADLKWHDFELLAGQDWSMMTPNRKGLGVMPSDLFYSQNTDTNYQAGLVWARQPGIRAIYHATKEVAVGFAAENPDQYAGGGNGSPAIVFPTGFNTAEVDTGVATSSPNLAPDLIAKIAFDSSIGDMSLHLDAAGLYRSFKINTFSTGAAPLDVDSNKSGYGGSINGVLGVTKTLNLIGNAYWSKGGGRYIFGQAPDLAVLPADSTGAFRLATIRADSYIGGAEWQAAPQSLLFGYYSTVNIGSAYGQQANGAYAGYGFPGSATSNNHRIEEFTIGETQTLWKNPSYGALQVMTQFSYLDRKAFYVPVGTPEKAHVGMLFVNLRYVLP